MTESGKEKLRIFQNKKRSEKQTQYNLNPKKCDYCNKVLDFVDNRKKFCNSSCAAKKTNKLKKGQKRKFSKIAIENIRSAANKRFGFPQTEIIFTICCCCTMKYFTRKKSPHKTCSNKCLRKLLSKQRSEYLCKIENRTNYGRGKKSYLEKSFEDWLIKNNIKFECEKRFTNSELGKNYFVDFLFEDKKIIVELDGTQHFRTKNSDEIRDKYFQSIGYNVIRITHKEYKLKTKEQLVLNLLM